MAPPILVRADAAGCTREFLNHLRDLRDTVVSCEFSVRWAITGRSGPRSALSLPGSGPTRSTLTAATATAPGWPRSPDEITGVLPARALAGYPAGIRIIVRRERPHLIVRRERPHPGAQLDAFEEADGWRYTAFATDTGFGQLAHLGDR
jgi:hypothetical protein